MTKEEIAINNEKMREAAKKAGANILEYDGEMIVGYGTDADYDTHAVDVINGNGYYDKDGYYISYPYTDED